MVNDAQGAAETYKQVMVQVRETEEIFKRIDLSSRFWVFRSGRPFVSATDPKTFELFVNILRGSRTQMHFVYRAVQTQERAFDEARLSFRSLEKKIATLHDGASILSRITEIPIVSADEANLLGLTDPWVSYSMAEYSEEGYAQYQRQVDVWMQFVFQLNTGTEREERSMVWLELAPQEAELWHKRREIILQKRSLSSPSTSSVSQ